MTVSWPWALLELTMFILFVFLTASIVPPLNVSPVWRILRRTIASLLKYVVALLLCFTCLQVQAQNVDSAKARLTLVKGPRERIWLMCLIGDRYGNGTKYLDSSMRYLNGAMQLATSLRDDSVIMEVEIRSGASLLNAERSDASMGHFNKAQDIALRRNYPGRAIYIMLYKSVALKSSKQYDEGVAECRAALDLARRTADPVNEAEAYNILASGYIFRSMYDSGLTYLGRAVHLFDSLHSTSNTAGCYSLMMDVLGRQKRYKEALKYLLISDSLYTVLNDSVSLMSARINFAIIYKNLGEYDKAIGYYKQALDYYAGDDYYVMFVATNLALAYLCKQEYGQALTYYHLSNNISSRSYHDDGIDFDNYKGMAELFYKIRQYDSALHYGKLAEKMGGSKDPTVEDYELCIGLLADIYASRGDITNAQAYYKRYQVLKDTLYARRLTKYLAEQETLLKLDEKNRALQLLAKENELHRVKGQRLLLALMFGALVVVGITIVYRRTARKNRLLLEQKQIIDAQVTQLEAAASMKARFLANISHELRTPVTLLTGMLELLKGRNGDGIADKEKLSLAYDNSKKLQHMIEEILDLSRMENKVTTLNSKATEAAPVIKRMVYSFETLLDSKHIALEFNNAAANAYIMADLDKLEKVMNNLVYNAVKFNSPGGKVVVGLDKKNDMLVITIRDTGSGISAEDLPHIFERFYQGGGESAAKSEGMGIGLSLVKEFVTLMDGEIKVDSTPGVGTIFTLSFPLTQPPSLSVTEEVLSIPSVEWSRLGSRNTVLVVEDNAEMRYYLREVLGGSVNMAEAGNGREALEWLTNNTPDAIISDIMMPEIDGLQLVSHLKASEQYHKIPIIMLSALANTDTRLSLLRIGVDDYMIKPFNADELRIRVYNLLSNYAARKKFNLEEPAEPGEQPIELVPDEGETFRQKIKDYVLVNIKKEDISVADIARELLLSERQLYRMAKGLTGCSPAQLVREVRLQRAYELLVSGDVSKVDEVAIKVGFGPSTYFSRVFSERFGKRPSEFL